MMKLLTGFLIKINIIGKNKVNDLGDYMLNKLFIFFIFFCILLISCQPENGTTTITQIDSIDTTTTTTTTIYTLSKVKNLSIERGSGFLKLSWLKENYDSVKIYYSTTPDNANKDQGIFLIDLTSDTSYKHTGLQYGTFYYYSLYTVLNTQYSEPANINNLTLNRSMKKINFYDELNWGSVNINTHEGISSQMDNIGNGWFAFATDELEEIIFNFKNNSSYLPAEGKFFRTSFDEIWVKNGIIYSYDPDSGVNPTDELCIISVNLHTYQEDNAETKLNKVTDVIAKIKPDFVCFQECGQHKDATVSTDDRAPYQTGIDKIKVGTKEKETNMVYLISKRLFETYNLNYNYYWSWAHYGWNVWEEGVAILTPHKIEKYENRYISTADTTSSIDSRKAVFIQADVPNIGKVNIFSAHTSWGALQPGQYDKLREFMKEKEIETSPVASIVGGDFNGDAGTDGYKRITSFTGGERLMDSYYIANNGGFNDSTMMGDSHNGISRIDYIFYNYKNKIIPKTAQVYFLPLPQDSDYLGSLVSDHNGVIVRMKVVK